MRYVIVFGSGIINHRIIKSKRIRIYLQLSKSNETVPFNYQSYLTGAIHKWIGKKNEIHDTVSLYSFSWFQNIDVRKEGIQTKPGSYFFISAYDVSIIKKIINGIREDGSVCFSIHVEEIEIVDDPQFSNREIFHTASPVFIKRRFDNNIKHITSVAL